MDSLTIYQSKVVKALRNLRLSGVKTSKHVTKKKKFSRTIPFDIYRCPRLVHSAFNALAFGNNYQIVLYKDPQIRIDN